MNSSIQRVAVVFDRNHRPETTGSYCLKALEKLVAAEHVPLDDLKSLSENAFDLFVRIDDGIPTEWPERLSPSAYWAIDTHLNFERSLAESRRFDLVFAAQRDGAEQLSAEGIDSTQWLPLAADPEIHRHYDVEPRWDVSFVGHINCPERQRLLELIQREFPDSFVGQRFFEEMAQVYSQSRIVFNRSIKNDLNMRVFEAMATGALLVTNDLSSNGQSKLFQDGKHLVTYRDEEELVEKIHWYLANDEARHRVAQAGQQEILQHHTYRHRMQTILDAAEKLVGNRDQWKRLHAINQANESAHRSENGKRTSGKETHQLVKDAGYFEFSRPEVVALIPTSAKSVLDIGCGAGRLGEAVNQRQDAQVTGIELNESAARLAEGRLDEVIVGNIESAEVEFPREQFDCIVCADILEHLRSPEVVLEKIHRWLKPEGRLVASLPNVRHHSVVRSLLAGNWTYETAGLLDEDHVRFFTRREMEKLLFRAGFEIHEMQMTRGPGDPQNAEPSALVNVAGFQFQSRSPEEAEEFFAYQYLFSAKRKSVPDMGVTSIVIVTHNQLPCTRLCLESIRRFTDEPIELIVVDNGSTDGTVDWLKRQSDVRLIENQDNLGFPKAANQGIKATGGNQVLLLNNDTVVTTGWLRRMLDAFARDPQIGLVGPSSNNVSGPQQIPVDYRQLNDLDGFAWDWGRQHRGEIQDADRLVGFCLLIRRDVVDRVGLLDEQFGIGCFEDDDYTRRALDAGFRAVITRGAFVHHFGGQTFHANGVDFAALMEENHRKYAAKWSRGVDQAESAEDGFQAGPRLRRHPSGGLLIDSTPPRLSLCMIVRDNEQTIRPALESIRPWVDEIIVVDTGSRDRTPEICAELGARVEFFQWCDDFSAARNESLKYASGEWIFWMDSDDTVPEECGRKLRELTYGSHARKTLGYVMQVHCPGADPSDVTVVDHVKLFRNQPELRFEHRIHEQILPAIRRAGGDVEFTDIYVVHSGTDHSEESRESKLKRDFRHLEKDLQDRPNHPFVLFNFGMTHADAGNHDEAVNYLKRSIRASHSGESHLRKAYALLVGSLNQRERHEEAWRICQESLDLFPDDPELRFRSGILLHQMGRLEDAVAAYRRVLTEQGERQFHSRDVGLKGFKARHNLALVLEDLARLREAETEWRAITQEMPKYRPGWRGLGRNLLAQQKRTAARDLSETLLASRNGIKVEGWLLQAQLAEDEGEIDAARRVLELAAQEYNEDVESRQALARLLFERVNIGEAEPVLRELCCLAPQDASVWHNLGMIYLATKRHPEAERAFRESLRLRPHFQATERLLDETQQSV